MRNILHITNWFIKTKYVLLKPHYTLKYIATRFLILNSLRHRQSVLIDLELQLDPATYIHDFFEDAHSIIDALTWHQYYLKGSTAKVADFINATVMETFRKQVQSINLFHNKAKTIEY